eukprot:GHVT01091091.1.p1 GENE.GHVT01091091.1~~GHVT01091091.1.p1  ORF type:complete len:389 (-),score=46.50 GHVT01091091.1:2459-3625(-)
MTSGISVESRRVCLFYGIMCLALACGAVVSATPKSKPQLTFTGASKEILDLVDKLREVACGIDLKLPDIAFVGDQSSGKSSVVEAISHVQLPRGKGIVTRCPLQLQLRDSDTAIPYAELWADGVPGRQRVEMDDVSKAILAMQDKLAGPNTGVVDRQIFLKVFRSGSPNLTLIDLPGIARNPVGDQPADIYDRIKDMVVSRIDDGSTIIANVIPADVDVAVSESIKWSRDVDPSGDRTLGIVTKLDKAEQDIMEKIEGRGARNFPLKLGYVGIRCRTQEEVARNTSAEELQSIEKRLIAGNSQLKKLAMNNRVGLSALQDILVRVQSDRINSSIPLIQVQLKKELKEAHAELKDLPVAIDSKEKAQAILHIIVYKVSFTMNNYTSVRE